MQNDQSPEEVKPILNKSQEKLFKKEAIAGCLCFGLNMWDMFRYFSHQSPVDPYHVPPTLGIPYQTEGIVGFFDQHVGDAGPTILLTYLARIPVEIGAKILEAATSRKLSSRAKLYIALSMGMAWPVLGELNLVPMPGTNEPFDLFGVAVAAIAVTASYEIGEFFSKSPPEKMVRAFGNIKKSLGIKTAPVLDKFRDLNSKFQII